MDAPLDMLSFPETDVPPQAARRGLAGVPGLNNPFAALTLAERRAIAEDLFAAALLSGGRPAAQTPPLLKKKPSAKEVWALRVAESRPSVPSVADWALYLHGNYGTPDGIIDWHDQSNPDDHGDTLCFERSTAKYFVAAAYKPTKAQRDDELDEDHAKTMKAQALRDIDPNCRPNYTLGSSPESSRQASLGLDDGECPCGTDYSDSAARARPCPEHGDYPPGSSIISSDSLNNGERKYGEHIIALPLVDENHVPGYILVVVATKKVGSETIVSVLTGPQNTLIPWDAHKLWGDIMFSALSCPRKAVISKFKTWAQKGAVAGNVFEPHVASVTPLLASVPFPEQLGAILQGREMPEWLRVLFVANVRACIVGLGGAPPCGEQAVSDATCHYMALVPLVEGFHRCKVGLWPRAEAAKIIVALLGCGPTVDYLAALLLGAEAAVNEAVVQTIAPDQIMKLLTNADGHSDMTALLAAIQTSAAALPLTGAEPAAAALARSSFQDMLVEQALSESPTSEPLQRLKRQLEIGRAEELAAAPPTPKRTRGP
jgi:hypothetical protein